MADNLRPDGKPSNRGSRAAYQSDGIIAQLNGTERQAAPCRMGFSRKPLAMCEIDMFPVASDFLVSPCPMENFGKVKPARDR
ncbi:hypothetical protein [Sphingobium terrigena]|uniref:hypothetical protein n=1 Tax=Sphingobium terrigena TaxID=2304063 RepID=UPI0011C391B0|nr:hypothetical protein [Sphingobium terrigena]